MQFEYLLLVSIFIILKFPFVFFLNLTIKIPFFSFNDVYFCAEKQRYFSVLEKQMNLICKNFFSSEFPPESNDKEKMQSPWIKK